MIYLGLYLKLSEDRDLQMWEEKKNMVFSFLDLLKKD